MNIAAIKLNKEGVPLDRLNKVCDKLRSVGIEPCFFDCDVKELCLGDSYKSYCADELLKKSDVVLALGGDGTILHTAKQAAMYDLPILGINSGHMGFMAGLENYEIDLLDRLKSGEYITEPRMMLEIEVISGDEVKKKCYCLNDAVFARDTLSRPIDVSVSFGAKTEMEYRCDGIIAATPTGSTAYSLSAGGPVLDPSINCMLITPICAHSFSARSLVLSPDTVVTVEARKKDGCFCNVTADGETPIDLKDGEKVRIRRSANHFARLIKIKNESFMDVIHSKLVDRR